MTPTQLRKLFRQYADEPDQTFLPDADVATYLDQGYRDLRRVVSQIAPMTFATTTTLTASGVSELDLTATTPALLGAAPTGARLVDLVSVDERTAAGTILRHWFGCASEEELTGERDRSGGLCYYLRGSVLRLGRLTTADLTLTWVPEHSVDFAAGSYIDDLVDFHDLIALYGLDHYAIRDGAADPMVIARRQDREAALAAYLRRRGQAGARYVRSVG